MNDLTLQQMEKLGISKWMNDKEVQKAIEKALEEQNELIANDSHKEVFDALRTTDEILVEGGLFTWKLEDRNVRCSVLTPQDMQLMEDISNAVEQGVEYKDLPIKYRYHIKTALGNYLFIKAKSYDEAKKVVDSILGVGLYLPSAGNI
jgi:hypothetical protein